MALGDADALVHHAYALVVGEGRVERLVHAKGEGLPGAFHLKAGGLLLGGLRSKCVLQPPPGVDRLSDVDSHDVFRLEVRVERLRVRAEYAGWDPQERRGQRGRIEDVQVNLREIRRPCLTHACLLFTQPFFGNFELLIASNGQLERPFDGEWSRHGARRRRPRILREGTCHRDEGTDERKQDEQPGHADRRAQVCGHRPLPPDAQAFQGPLEQQVGDRHHDQRQQCRGDQSANRGDRDRCAELAAFTVSDGGRHHAEHHRDRRHHDGAQPHGACGEQRLPDGQPLAPELIRVVDEQDRVLGDQAHQHHDADHGRHADVVPRGQQEQ